MRSKRLAVAVGVVNRLVNAYLSCFTNQYIFYYLKLYSIGGFDGEHRLSSMECYHPENNAWTDMPPMKFSRSGAGVAVLNQFIYVCMLPNSKNYLSFKTLI